MIGGGGLHRRRCSSSSVATVRGFAAAFFAATATSANVRGGGFAASTAAPTPAAAHDHRAAVSWRSGIGPVGGSAHLERLVTIPGDFSCRARAAFEGDLARLALRARSSRPL